jgi:tRNA(fMet)-specific endonuclease VapC
LKKPAKLLVRMIGNKFLLDTNIVIEVFEGNTEIADRLNKLSNFFISVVVLGELYIGVNRVVNKAKHLKKLNDFLEMCIVLPIDSNIAKQYGETVAALYKKGKPLPINDIWIAATGLQHKLTLVTRDKHFNEISGLKIKNW